MVIDLYIFSFHKRPDILHGVYPNTVILPYYDKNVSIIFFNTWPGITEKLLRLLFTINLWANLIIQTEKKVKIGLSHHLNFQVMDVSKVIDCSELIFSLSHWIIIGKKRIHIKCSFITYESSLLSSTLLCYYAPQHIEPSDTFHTQLILHSISRCDYWSIIQSRILSLFGQLEIYNSHDRSG